MEGDVVKRVTVLMAVYNPPLGMLDEAIDSILGQTYREFEFLILDDGSTQEEVRTHLQRRAAEDSRIRVSWEPHRGLTKSLNRGLELAEGEWIARQDADDWSSADRLERQMAFVEMHPTIGLCGSNVQTHQQNGTGLWATNLPRTREELLQAFPRGNPFVHGSVLFRKEAAVASGGYREVFPCSQDYDLFWRMTEQCDAANLAEPLYHYRYTSGSVSAGRALDQLRAHLAIRMLALSRQTGVEIELAEALERAGSEAASSQSILRAMLKQADHTMLAGDYGRAWRLYLNLLAGHLRSPLAWGKLARLALFQAVPGSREVCFR
jgi:glycosyltransferase involved in cell wall biosynthesis